MGSDVMHQPSFAGTGVLAGFVTLQTSQTPALQAAFTAEDAHATVRQERPATGLAARVPAAADAMFTQFGVAEQERTPPWLRPRSTTTGRESHLIETFRQSESPVTPNPRSHSPVAMSAERVHHWSEHRELLEDLLSLLADQPSNRLLNPHDALFAQVGRHDVG